MADRGINQVATAEIGVQAKIEDKKIKRRKPKSKPPWIDLGRLWKEFRKSNSTHQQQRVYILRFYLPNGTVVLKGQINSKKFHFLLFNGIETYLSACNLGHSI